MSKSPLNLWIPQVLGYTQLPRKGKVLNLLLLMSWQISSNNDYTGASTNNVCSPVGDERQTGSLLRFSSRCVCSPSDFTEGGGTKGQYPKLSALSGEMAKGEMSSEQWSYELQTLCKSYSDSVLREGIQHSLTGAVSDAVCNMVPNIPLDMILKKFTVIYGNVKSFNLLMRDFYRADQGEDETIPSFATRIEGLLSQIRDRFPNQLPHQEEQRLLKDCLFHGSRKKHP